MSPSTTLRVFGEMTRPPSVSLMSPSTSSTISGPLLAVMGCTGCVLLWLAVLALRRMLLLVMALKGLTALLLQVACRQAPGPG